MLADGTFAELLLERNLDHWTHIGMPPTLGAAVQVFPPSQPAAVKGAALAAAAIAHGLPCYRETLLPLDLYVRGTDEYGDPAPQWKELVTVRSVEAGQDSGAHLPRSLGCKSSKAKIGCRCRCAGCFAASPCSAKSAPNSPRRRNDDEPVRVEVEVKPGQGFARVRIESVTPGVFATRLDWRTMEECDEPKPPPLAYLPGVSRILPDEQMFNDARPALEAALHALQQNSPDAIEHGYAKPSSCSTNGRSLTMWNERVGAP